MRTLHQVSRKNFAINSHHKVLVVKVSTWYRVMHGKVSTVSLFLPVASSVGVSFFFVSTSCGELTVRT